MANKKMLFFPHIFFYIYQKQRLEHMLGNYKKLQ